jgi:hypothetical protein
VILSSATPGAKIRYRLQGGDWQLWKSPFVLKQAGMVEAIAEAPEKLASAVSARDFPYALPRDGFRVLSADSEQTDEGEAANAIDGKPDTYWHTRWQGQAPRPPHEIAIDLGVKAELAGITVLPRQDQENGRIGDYEVYTSTDGASWGEPAAKGRFGGGQGLEKVMFPKALAARYIKLIALTEINNQAWSAVAEVDAIALRLLEPPQVRDEWSIFKATSEQPGEGEADHLIDGKPGTFWHTQYGLFLAKHPHEVTVDLGKSVRLRGMSVLPRQDSRNGRIKSYRVTTSGDGESWSEPVAAGDFAYDITLQTITFRQPVTARFVKFSALSAHDGDDFATAAEFDFLTSP